MTALAVHFSSSSSASSSADPMRSMSRDPCRDEYTICTAAAPDPSSPSAHAAPGTLRPGLVRNFSSHEPRTRRSARYTSHETMNVAQVR